MAQRIAVDRIASAAKTLTALDLGRQNTTLIMWMAVKAAGANPDTPVRITPDQVSDFCDDYFRVPGPPPYSWFDPFSGHWWRTSTNGGWPIGTIWTQLLRTNQKLRAAMDIAPDAEWEGKSEQRRPRLVQLRGGDDYIAAVTGIVTRHKGEPPHPVPMLELAIWRYRFGPPADVTDESSLIDALVTELHLTDAERGTVFTTGAAT